MPKSITTNCAVLTKSKPRGLSGSRESSHDLNTEETEGTGQRLRTEYCIDSRS